MIAERPNRGPDRKKFWALIDDGKLILFLKMIIATGPTLFLIDTLTGYKLHQFAQQFPWTPDLSDSLYRTPETEAVSAGIMFGIMLINNQLPRPQGAKLKEALNWANGFNMFLGGVLAYKVLSGIWLEIYDPWAYIGHIVIFTSMASVVFLVLLVLLLRKDKDRRSPAKQETEEENS